jgi:hypothetical protein
VSAAEQAAAAIIADPAFASNPTAFIAHATGRAADAATVTGVPMALATPQERRTLQRYWTTVALALCEAAGIEPGAVLIGLRDGT